jgi:hypothetical protein
MKPQNQRKTRRTVLAATGVAAAFGLAGCVSGDDGDGDGTEPDAGNGGTDPGEADGDERTVTLLVEGVGGHGDGDGGGEEHEHSETEGEHDDGQDGEGEYDDGQDGEKEHDHGHNETEGDHDGSEGHDYGDEGLTSEELGHACNHMTEVEEFGAEDVEAGASAEEAPHLSEVHHPYRVTYGAESGYVRFELGDHANSEDGEHGHDGERENEHDDGADEHNHDAEMLAFFTQSGVASVVEGELVYSETDGVESCDSIDRYVVVEAHGGSAVVELTAGL